MKDLFTDDLSGGSGASLDDFEGGQEVIYVPRAKRLTARLQDCQRGTVTSHNASFVFVRYWNKSIFGYDETAQATSPEDLWKI